MSYLLKALEKAEQEREQQTHNEALPFAQSQEPSRLPVGLIAFVVIALGATFLKVMLPSAHEPVTEVVANDAKEAVVTLHEEKPTMPDVSAPDEQLIEPILITPDRTEHRNLVEHSVPVKDSSVKMESSTEEKILELYELPKNMLAKIPTLTLESHIYSSAAEYRSVVINGRTFKEGMMINAQVVLNSITNKGVVLDVSGQKVSLDKGITWVASSNAK